MCAYNNIQDAIIGMHEQGFIHDFHFSGNNLFWVQGKTMVNAGDFCVLECYSFLDKAPGCVQLIVLGICTYSCNAKGILIFHYNGFNNNIPFMLTGE